MAPFPLGTRYVANIDVIDPNPYTPKQFPVIGDIEQVAVGNTIIRAGLTKSQKDHSWHQTLHLVLTPAEREDLIAVLIEHRQAAPAEATASKKSEIQAVTTKPRTMEATHVREGDEMPLFVGTDLPCGSERIASRDNDDIRWVRVDEVRVRSNGRTREFLFNDASSQEFTYDEFVVVRERVYLAD